MWTVFKHTVYSVFHTSMTGLSATINHFSLDEFLLMDKKTKLALIRPSSPQAHAQLGKRMEKKKKTVLCRHLENVNRVCASLCPEQLIQAGRGRGAAEGLPLEHPNVNGKMDAMMHLINNWVNSISDNIYPWHCQNSLQSQMAVYISNHWTVRVDVPAGLYIHPAEWKGVDMDNYSLHLCFNSL